MRRFKMNITRTCLLRRFFSLALVCAVFQLGGCATSTQLQAEDAQAIAGKTYVVTGASSGLGKGVALELASLGANVVLAARRTDALNEVAAEIKAGGGAPLVVTTDVSKPEDIQKLANSAIARFGRLDVWINNAGVGAIGPFEQIPLKDHARVVDVNLNGVIYGSHVAMRQFRSQGFGTLVNIGSVESEVPLAYHASYAATKAGVLGLGRALDEEIRLSGNNAIAVTTVMPWATDTPFFENAANYSGGTPRMIAMDEPQKAVDAIVWASINPRREVPVGWKARGATLSGNLFPGLTQHIAGNIVHRYQIETAPPAPATSGALHQPIPTSTTVDGGVRQRMERENAARD
jgi:short-subunit dehydrogenase